MSLRDIERASIRAFLESHSDLFGTRRVLDYGCGRQPYRQLIEDAGGIYTGIDSPTWPGSVASEDTDESDWDMQTFDVIVSTQTLQYMTNPVGELGILRDVIADDGWLLMTGPINWPWIEKEDRRRYTPTELTDMLHRAWFTRVQVDVRASVKFEGEEWAIGWQAVARP